MSTLDFAEPVVAAAGPPTATTDEQLAQLTATVAWMAEEIRAQQALREELAELVGELSGVARPALAAATLRLTQAEARGWFAFAHRAGRVADRVVASAAQPHQPTDPPGTLALLRQLRDPDVRRALARLLVVLRAMGAEQGRPEDTRTNT